MVRGPRQSDLTEAILFHHRFFSLVMSVVSLTANFFFHLGV